MSVDRVMLAKHEQAIKAAEAMAAQVLEGYELYAEAHDDERAANLRSQTRDSLSACIFNEVVQRSDDSAVRHLGPTLDRVCASAADGFRYKTWYGLAEVERINSDCFAAMRDRIIEFPIAPFQEVYRLNDRGDYVSSDVFEGYWAGKPERDRIAWMLSDNGQLSGNEVAEMTYEEAKEFYDSGEFVPEIAFFTTADETGWC